MLFTPDPVVRKMLLDPVYDQPVGLLVNLRHKVAVFPFLPGFKSTEKTNLRQAPSLHRCLFGYLPCYRQYFFHRSSPRFGENFSFYCAEKLFQTILFLLLDYMTLADFVVLLVLA